MFKRLQCLYVLISLSIPFMPMSVAAGDLEVMSIKLEAAALKGNAEAMYHMGMLYNNGIGVTKNFAKAFEWFKKSAAAGDPLGAYKLGCYYSGQAGEVVKVDEEKALHFKKIAADAGYTLAQSDVGIAFFKLKKFSEAEKYWKLGALQGEPQCTYNLSQLYSDGKALPKNLTLLYAYFKLSQLFARGELTENARKSLDGLAGQMTKEQKAAAEKVVDEWKVKKSDLTRKAQSGLEAAKKLAGI